MSDCAKCRRALRVERSPVAYGNGVTSQPCPYCGAQHYQFPSDMRQRSGSARICAFSDGCGQFVDTVAGKYCRKHRIHLQQRGRRGFMHEDPAMQPEGQEA